MIGEKQNKFYIEKPHKVKNRDASYGSVMQQAVRLWLEFTPDYLEIKWKKNDKPKLH